MMKNKLTNNCASFIKSGLLAAILLAISFYSVAYAASGTGVDPSLTVLSARSLALGQAGAALSDDGDAIFNNPAGLAYAKFPKLSVSQKKLLLDEADLSSLGFAVPTDWGVFGIAGMDTSTGGSLPTMRDATNNRITVNPSTAAYSYDNNVVFLSYSRKYDQYLSFGGNYKIFNQSLTGGLGGTSAHANNLDLSAFYHKNWWAISADWQNMLGGSLNWDTTAETSDKLATNIKIGSAVYILGENSREALYKNPDQRLTGVFDLDLPSGKLTGNSLALHGGLEWWPLKSLTVRAGFNMSDAGSFPTYGVGFTQSGWRFDYAYYPRPDAPVGESAHYVTISMFEVIPRATTDEAGTYRVKGNRITIFQPKDRSIVRDAAINLKGQLSFVNEKWKRAITTEVLSVIPQASIPPATLALPSTTALTSSRETSSSIEATKPAVASIISAEAVRASTEAITASREVGLVASSAEVSPKLTAATSIEPLLISVTKEITAILSLEVLPPIGFKSLSINDTPVAINSIGSFEGLYQLGFGKNVFRVHAEMTGEAVNAQTRVLRYKPFIDVPAGYEFEMPIALTSSLKLIEGYPDNSFKPEKGISRAELVTVLMRSQGIVAPLTQEAAAKPTKRNARKQKTAGLPIFKDLYTSHWAAAYIKAAVEKGIVTGYPDGSFRPNAVVKRAEGVAIFSRFAALPDELVSREVASGFSYFSDVNNKQWLYLPSLKTRKIGMLEFIHGNLFDQNAAFLRSHTADMLTRTPAIQARIEEFWERGTEITSNATVETQMPQWLQNVGTKEIITKGIIVSSAEMTTITSSAEIIPKAASAEAGIKAISSEGTQLKP